MDPNPERQEQQTDPAVNRFIDAEHACGKRP